MWICSRLGFFSIVRKEQPETWQVRARCERDLCELLEAAGLDLEIVANAQADYAFRFAVDSKGLSRVFGVLGHSIDYPNFKGCIAAIPHQRDKLAVYDDFWSGMRAYQQTVQPVGPAKPPTASEQVTRQLGGHLSRVLETLNGFKEKYGHWPTTLRLSPVAIEALRDKHLTPLGFQILRTKLELVVGEQERLKAEDDAGLAFDYVKEGWSGNSPPRRAEEWLWGIKLC
jgi:hypothetical protein